MSAINPSHVETLRRFCSAMDAIADAIYLVDRSSMRILYVNQAACRLHNLTREALIAQEPWALLEISRVELERNYDSLIDSIGEVAPLELLRHRSGLNCGAMRNTPTTGGPLSRWCASSLTASNLRPPCLPAKPNSAAYLRRPTSAWPSPTWTEHCSRPTTA